jgi:hypothetical protein
MIRTDTSAVSSLAVCDREQGGCGWRSPVARTREKALAWAAIHRAEQHTDKTKAARKP